MNIQGTRAEPARQARQEARKRIKREGAGEGSRKGRESPRLRREFDAGLLTRIKMTENPDWVPIQSAGVDGVDTYVVLFPKRFIREFEVPAINDNLHPRSGHLDPTS